MIHQHQIRKMTHADVPAVCELDQATDITPWNEKLITDCINIGYECWVIIDQTLVTGFAIMSFGANEAHLLKLGILPAYHHQGLGQRLLQYLINIAKTHGVEEMYLEVRVSNHPAIALYRKNNFVEIGMRKGYYPPNELKNHPKEDALTMALALW
ncbi:MAG TPA: ribosomal protein S18-alanine N-acetyltransferase [Gammaproteobacteria bacterium]|nr:ribosomal protein S18-alanine N-acetyltransferase [Gammaproteobacteria bacterium]